MSEKLRVMFSLSLSSPIKAENEIDVKKSSDWFSLPFLPPTEFIYYMYIRY